MLSDVQNALLRADSLEDVEYIENKIKTTQKLNRRLKKHRELQEKLLQLCNRKAQQLIDNGAMPFN